MSDNSFKTHHRKRRQCTLWVQAGLSVLIVVLLFGISYASVSIYHGQPVFHFSFEAASQENSNAQDLPPKAPATEGESQAEPILPEDAALPPKETQVQDAQPKQQLWNTADVQTPHGTAQSDDARMLAVPENGRVSDEYFRDALFIGDSVTQGFGWYEDYRGRMKVCAYKGTNPRNVLQNYIGQCADGTTQIEMWDDIKMQTDVANIYVLFGANALVNQTDEVFLATYSELLDRLRERFPGVPIYVQSITPTQKARGEKQPQLERSHLLAINNRIAQMACSKQMYYIDLWEPLADENGYLKQELAGSDGLHLRDAQAYRPWLDYLASHTVYSAHNAPFAVSDNYA